MAVVLRAEVAERLATAQRGGVTGAPLVPELASKQEGSHLVAQGAGGAERLSESTKLDLEHHK